MRTSASPPPLPRSVAFLRAINVGGRTVSMAALRQLFAEMGFAGAETFIASGNVIFRAVVEEEAVLARQIERHLEKALGYEVGVFLRTETEVAAVAAYAPFPPEQLAGAAALNVAFLTQPLNAAEKRKLAGFETEIDTFHAHGREVYWLCSLRQSDSRFSNRVFEKTMGLRTTFRGLQSVRKLAGRLAAPAA